VNPTERTIATTRSPSDALPGEGWAERFFELAVDPLAVVGFDGAFKRVNPFWVKLFGWPAGELLARPYAEFVHPDDRDGLQRALRALVEEAPPGRDVELRFRCRDGSYRWLSVSGQASRDEQLVYVVAKDVTGRRRAEQALRHSEERFRSVIAALDEGIVVQDADGIIQACNEAAERILGTTAEAMRTASPDSPPWRAIAPDGRTLSPEERPSVRTLRTGVPVTGEIVGVVRNDESVAWLSVNSYPLGAGADRAPRAVVSSFTDITQSKDAEDALREAEERFRTAFDAAPIGVAVVDLEGRYQFVNPAMSEILGVPASEVSGRDFREFTHPEDVPRQEECTARLVAGETPTVSFEKRYLRADGLVTWVLLTAAVIRDGEGEPRYLVHQILDITERRHAQQELERSNADLEQFASAASHDLREPLVVVKGYLELLTQRHTANLNEEGQRFLATAVEAVERMQSLIADLLDWSRAGADIHRRTVDAASLAQEAVLAVGHHVRSQGTDVQIGELPSVRAEPTALRRVFQNLLSNAVKFGRRDAAVVRVTADREGAAWRFTIADNGPGIPPDQRERAFAMFERLGARQKGTGIGLAICRRIVERHGGRMWVDEAPEGGAAFHFTIED
jgi:PAS domain S-box-containing protein